MKKFVLVVLLFLSVLAATACGSQADKAARACMVGTWQLTDMETFARAVLPPGAFEQKSLKFNGGAGLLGYTFTEDGQITVEAFQWMAQFSVAEGTSLYRLDLQINGVANGKFSLEDDIVRVDSVQSSHLTYLAVFDDETMVDTFQANEFVPLFVPDYNQARFECSDSTLSLFLLNQPGIEQPVLFQRVVKQQE